MSSPPTAPRVGPIEDQIVHACFADHAVGTMVDVGAHTGTSARPFLERGWRVVAFEPDPSKHAQLQRLVDRHGLKLHTCALADRPGDDAPFFTSPESTGIASLLAFRDSHAEALRVPVRTLRDVLAEDGVERIDYLKVDAEGYDLRVLQGAPWEQLQPDVVMCEFETNKTAMLGYTTRDLGDFLVARGYGVFMSEWFPIVRYGGNHTWRSIRPYPCEPDDERGWGNFLAARPGEPLQRLTRAVEAACESAHREAARG